MVWETRLAFQLTLCYLNYNIEKTEFIGSLCMLHVADDFCLYTHLLKNKERQ